MGDWLQWLAIAVLVALLPALVRWGKRNARGSMGSAALLIGLAFGHLFDPAKGQATEALLKKRETGEASEALGEGPEK